MTPKIAVKGKPKTLINKINIFNNSNLFKNITIQKIKQRQTTKKVKNNVINGRRTVIKGINALFSMTLCIRLRCVKIGLRKGNVDFKTIVGLRMEKKK